MKREYICLVEWRGEWLTCVTEGGQGALHAEGVVGVEGFGEVVAH